MSRARPLTPLYGAAFVLAVDNAGAGHLFPALERATDAPPRGASWFLSIYMLGALVGAPLVARMAEKWGRVRVLATSLFAFALASFIVGASASYPLTLAGRLLQGLAGAAVMPLGAAHLAAVAEEGKKGRGFGLLSLSYSGGFLAGMAFVSLFLLVSFRLAYIFVGSASLIVAASLARLAPVPERSCEPRPSPEIATIVGWFVALALVSFALSHAGTEDLTLGSAFERWSVRGAQLAAAPALVGFVLRDRRTASPLLPRELLASRIGAASAALSIAAGIGQACVVLLPSCAMVQLGVSAPASGPLLLPVVVGGLAANVLVSARLDRWGPRPFLACGLALMALGALGIAAFGTNLIAFELGALLLGSGVSALSSGALRYLATLHGPRADADMNQAAVSLLTNVGVLVAGALWGAIVPSATQVPVATVRAGLLVLTACIVPFGLALAAVPRRRALRDDGASG